MKKIKRILAALILTLSIFFSVVSVIPASASVSWPSFNADKPIHVYTIQAENKDVYKSNHDIDSGHYTEKNDEIKIRKIYDDGWCKFKYPTPSGSRKSYAPLDFFIVGQPEEVFVAQVDADTYRRPGLKQKAGEIDRGDEVRKLGEYNGDVQVLYNIGSVKNPSGFRAAWISRDTYSALKQGGGTSYGRNSDSYNKAINDRDVNHNYLPDQYTYCNWFVADVLEAYDAPLPRELANDMYKDLSSGYGGWYECSAKEAQNRANKGYTTVVAYYNNNGHGHIAVVRPENNEWKYSKKRGAVIAQAGRHNFNYGNTKDGFGDRSVKYFTHD